MAMDVTAIFDIGKTNKKLFLFDKNNQVVYEYVESLPETVDIDGFACEDLPLLEKWIKERFLEQSKNPLYNISKLNFSAYGASFVHLDEHNNPIAPLYNYLKPLEKPVAHSLYTLNEGWEEFSRCTASPAMGMLNSGLQLWWLQNEKSALFSRIATSLHLPQYLSFLFTCEKYSDITSIGCHTALWNFDTQAYHKWLIESKINKILPHIIPSNTKKEIVYNGKNLTCGVGLHDSSAALIPYLKKNKKPFILLSTGTWNIALNPFNNHPLTIEELEQDCLCYLRYDGKPVKASRLFFGNEHDHQVQRLSTHFYKPLDYFKGVNFESQLISTKLSSFIPSNIRKKEIHLTKEKEWDLSVYSSFEQGYHSLMKELVALQIKSLALIMDCNKSQQIYVDGGFANSQLFINFLQNKLPQATIIPSKLANASALGASQIMENV